MISPRKRKPIPPIIKWLLIILALIVVVCFEINASQTGGRVEGCLSACSVASSRVNGPLRVVSLNMLHGFPSFQNLPLRVELLTAELTRLDADVVLLQEVPWTWQTGNVAEKIAALVGYNHLFFRANGNHHLIFFEEGEAILSRYPLKDPVSTVLKPRVGWFENRVALGATVVTPWGDVQVVVTHLTDKSPASNLPQAEQLLEWVNSVPGEVKLVAGDFNAGEDSPQIRSLASQWVDAYRLTHPWQSGLTCCIDHLTAFNDSLEKRIDYIFLSGSGLNDWTAINVSHVFDHPFQVGNGWQWVSDHIGLMLELAPSP